MKPPPDARQRAQATVGQGVQAIDTPSLVIDLDAMERNLERMAVFARERGLRLRPHAKMHKSAELARLQMAHGAVGVCVQKTDEALGLAAAGVNNIYISNQVIAAHKLARLARAVHEGASRFAIAVDSSEGIDQLALALRDAGVRSPAAIDVFVEIDVGQGRCGVPAGDAAIELVRHLGMHPALRWAGLQAYHGGAQHRRTPAERSDAIATSAQAVRQTIKALSDHGCETPLVTGAGTGSFVNEADSGLWGELQAGSYLFLDADYAANEADAAAPGFEHALFVKSQVMSVAPGRPNQAGSTGHAVCDAGHKSHAIDSGLPLVVHPPGLVFANGGDEHGLLRVATPEAVLPGLGDTVWLIPGHCDPTVNLHGFFVGVRGGLIHGHVERLITIDTRGALV
jgi:D-serine deaminase-like pyridoxal phosphate-dependent protein